MDLDDLLEDAGTGSAHNNNIQFKRIQSTKDKPLDAEDEWGDTSIQPKVNGLHKAKSTKNKEESKQQVEEEEDWGDLEVQQDQQSIQQTVNMKLPPEQQQVPEDDWGIITPAPPKKKKVEEIGVKSRKQEDPDEEDDEWGDTTSTKFQLKSENFTSNYDSSSFKQPQLCKNTATVLNGTKCFPLVIGGANLEQGLSEDSMMPKSCSSLRCFKCDKKVQRFINGTWHATVDYMFVRNHNTNVAKLAEGVQYAPGFSAYACQCQFISLNEPDKDKCEELKWMCGGHPA